VPAASSGTINSIILDRDISASMARQTFESAAFDDEEKPLDPTLLRVQARLRRLMLIAGLTLGIGILAVLGAMLYRINGPGTTAKPLPAGAAVSVDLAAAGLPPDAKLVSSALDGNRLALTYEDATGSEVLIVDVKSATVIGRMILRR
jgi:hypothetical protein